ncbi:DUF3099 domain-containing protein [Pseudolysinimonas sp.]
MRPRPASLTDLPPSPADEQGARMRRYAITMGIRTLCVVAMLFTPGWWLLVPALGAVFLPYVAVVFANAVTRRRGAIESPGGVVRRDAS